MYALIKYDDRASQAEAKIEAFKTDSRKVVKNNLFYGSHYQQLDQKYIPKPMEAPQALKSWQKDIKGNEWNRNPNNPYTKKARDFLYYNSTRPY